MIVQNLHAVSTRFIQLLFFTSNGILFDVPVSALYDKSPTNVCVCVFRWA